MRENIGLYRGKRKDNGERIEGSLLKVTIGGESYYLIFGDDFAFDGNDFTALSHALVDPETVGECSGLPDKTGKLIFEGDIVKTDKFGEPNKWYIIKFDLQLGAFVGEEARHNMYFTTFDGDSDLFEVIGNIHDNPELLEVSDQ